MDIYSVFINQTANDTNYEILNEKLDVLKQLTCKTHKMKKKIQEKVTNTITFNELSKTLANIGENSPRGYIEKIELILKGLNNIDLFTKIKTYLDNHPLFMCNLLLSEHQLFVIIYEEIISTILMNYIMAQAGFSHLNRLNEQMSIDLDDLVKKLLNQIHSYLITKILPQARMDVRKCDPDEHISGETFIEIIHFLNGLIINEENLNSAQSCSNDCRDYKAVPVGRHNNYMKCPGTITNCQDSGTHIELCESVHLSNLYN